MNDLIIYQIQAGINLNIMYTFYWLFMRNDSMHKVKRMYLISSLFLSFIIPLLNLKALIPTTHSFSLLRNEISLGPVLISEHDITHFNSINLLLVFYLIISGIFAIRYLLQFAIIGRTIAKYQVTKSYGLKIVSTNQKDAAFSFFNYVFLGSELQCKDQLEKILEHERVHFRQNHSIDLIILELIFIFQWFNPVVWLLKGAFRDVHEYLADEGVLKTGVCKSDYQKMLMDQTFSINFNSLINSFNHSLIKRRFIMMSKVHKNKKSDIKVLLVLPAAALLTVFLSISFSPNILAQETKKAEDKKVEVNAFENNSQEEVIFAVVEKMPQYPGGEEARIKFMVENIKYPANAREKGVQGTVFISFVVEKDGTITNVKTLRGIGGGCDEEATRVVSMMPPWKPGVQKGQPVRVQFNMPVKFSLEEKKEKPLQENPEDK